MFHLLMFFFIYFQYAYSVFLKCGHFIDKFLVFSIILYTLPLFKKMKSPFSFILLKDNTRGYYPCLLLSSQNPTETSTEDFYDLV